MTDKDIIKCRGSLPILTMRNESVIDLDDSVKYSAKKLFNVKNKTSLACGPDTISMRHIQDLFPSVEKFLQKAIDKPIDKIIPVRENFNRLILKDSSEKPPHTAKSFRPIAELDLIPKYSTIKIFGEQLRNQIVPKMSGNQYAMPTLGCQAAISDTFDEIFYNIKSGMYVMLAITDQSNAFCVTDHDVAEKIAKDSYDFSPRMLEIFKQYQDQTVSTVKISHKNGFFFSQKTDMRRGNQQGQICSDTVFQMLNEAILPVSCHDTTVSRKKFIDDWTDVYASKKSENIFRTLNVNQTVLLKQCTSLGLKLNDSKTQILAFNIPKTDIRTDLEVITDAKFLGFEFKGTEKGPSGDPAGEAVISDLGEACRVISALRKSEENIFVRIESATKLIYSILGNIGNIYVYASNTIFERIACNCRKVIKAAGLDQLTKNETVYRIAFGYNIGTIAKKQIIQGGLKKVSMTSIKKDRFKVVLRNGDDKRPFLATFAKLFNDLPTEVRRKIAEKYDKNHKNKVNSVKNILRNHFLNEYN